MSIYLIGLSLSILLVTFVMPFYIKLLKSKNVNQITSEYALNEYKNKDKTPIMGGLIFVIVPVIVFFLLRPEGISDKRTLFIILSFVLFCIVGLSDDLIIIARNKNDGLSPITRLVMELAITIGLYFIFKDVIPNQITIPFVHIGIQFNPIFFIPFMSLLYMAEANAVNFTDGMDGLCAGVSAIGLVAFAIINVVRLEDNISLLIFCVIGGLIGYLFFNHHPAKIFMGDSGSLALGALFSSLAIMGDLTIALFIIGGVFVIEMFCVCLQQISVRLFHKKVFSYTPIHYSFVIKGYKEQKIVLCFYGLALILAVIGLIIGLNTL